jgi:hypothetical protein
MVYNVFIGLNLHSFIDALDSGNAKRATQEADKLLKKHADLCAAKVCEHFFILYYRFAGIESTVTCTPTAL